jgi:hypothetical protein
MRNYFQTYYQAFDHYIGGDFQGVLNHYAATTEEGVAFAASLPGFPDGYVAQDVGELRWILYNKTILLDALNNGDLSAHVLIEFQTPRKGIDGSYASGWPSNDGDPKGPTANKHIGDEKRFKADYAGASTLYQAFTLLAQWATQLRAAKKFREAGIVQFAYDQVVRQVWSISQAFLYLRENRLL